MRVGRGSLLSTMNVCVNGSLLTYIPHVWGEVWTSFNPILASLFVRCMCETRCYTLKYVDSLRITYLSASLPGVSYLQSLSLKGISTIFQQPNKHLMVPVYLSICLSPFLHSTCETRATHLVFICGVCSLCRSVSHTHLLSLLLSFKGSDWISVLTLSTAPAPLQMTNLKRRREELWVKRTFLMKSFVIFHIVTFPFRVFCSWNTTIQALQLYVEWVSQWSALGMSPSLEKTFV